MISLKKYHYRHLGALERDLDSFNKSAGLPVEIVEALNRLHISTSTHDPLAFCQSPLLREFIEFLHKIPEGLIPFYYSSKIATGNNENSIRSHLKLLPLENYRAFRCIAFFVKSICFNCERILIPFQLIDETTGLCDALSPAPRDVRLKPILVNIFKDPARYFYSNSKKQQMICINKTNN